MMALKRRSVRMYAARAVLVALALAAVYGLWALRITLATPVWWGGLHPRVLSFAAQIAGTGALGIALVYLAGWALVRLFRTAGWW